LAQRSASVKEIRVNLAGVEQIGQRVDNRNRANVGQLLNLGMIERPDDKSMHKPRQNPRRVGNRLAATELNIIFYSGKADCRRVRGCRPRRTRGCASTT